MCVPLVVATGVDDFARRLRHFDSDIEIKVIVSHFFFFSGRFLFNFNTTLTLMMTTMCGKILEQCRPFFYFISISHYIQRRRRQEEEEEEEAISNNLKKKNETSIFFVVEIIVLKHLYV